MGYKHTYKTTMILLNRLDRGHPPVESINFSYEEIKIRPDVWSKLPISILNKKNMDLNVNRKIDMAGIK
jgi:hypothetical protein